MGSIVRIAAVLSLAGLLAACGATYRTYWERGVSPEVSRGWRLAEVRVSVPDSLKVSEERTYVPLADIVWREDPVSGELQARYAQRRAQVDRIMTDAARRGASRLRGSRPVRLDIVVTRFHAMTFEAEWRAVDSGVHNIDFTISAVDARTGAVLAGPEAVESAEPAFSGPSAVMARSQGQTQKSVITAHVAETVAGWLGIGPDVRGSFSRLGD